MRKRAVVIILIAVLLFGCSTMDQETQSHAESSGQSISSTVDLLEESPPPKVPVSYALDECLPEDLRELVLHNREPLFQPVDAQELETALEKYLGDGPSAELDQRIASQVQTQPAASPDRLTIEQVEQELVFLMGYLKCSYAGYAYFGGDEFFLSAQQTILDEIKEYGDTITIESYQEIIDKHLLPVILDRHFYFGSTSYGDPYAYRYYSYNEDILFEKSHDSFYTNVEGVKYQLLQVDGNDPDEYLKPILTADGEMAWAIGVNHNAEINLSIALELQDENTGATVTIPVDLLESAPTPLTSDNTEHAPYEREEIDGIPVIHNRRLWADDEMDELSLQAMVDEALLLKGEAAIILDLRGNGGGSSFWAEQWAENFTGVSYLTDDIYCVLESQTVNSRYGVEDLVSEPGWREPRVTEAKVVPNNTLVVVLTDQHVGSSGELFYKYLRQMENVVFVGTNTQGCGLFGDAANIYLPQSNLRLHCGYKLFIETDFQFKECIGFPPDLWAPPDQALDRAVQLIHNVIDRSPS